MQILIIQIDDEVIIMLLRLYQSPYLCILYLPSYNILLSSVSLLSATTDIAVATTIAAYQSDLQTPQTERPSCS
jgi:hypothetical protein